MRVSGRCSAKALRALASSAAALPAVVGSDGRGKLAVDVGESLLEGDRAERVAARGHRGSDDREQQQHAEDDQHDEQDD